MSSRIHFYVKERVLVNAIYYDGIIDCRDHGCYY